MQTAWQADESDLDADETIEDLELLEREQALYYGVQLEEDDEAP